MSISSVINDTNYDANEDYIDLNDPNWSIDQEIEAVEGYRVPGFFVLVRLYSSPKKEITSGGIIIPDKNADEAHIDQQELAKVGLVVKFGPGVYKDEERYALTGPYCSIGEWINMGSRNAGDKLTYKGKKYMIIAENCVRGGLEDPRDVRIS